MNAILVILAVVTNLPPSAPIHGSVVGPGGAPVDGADVYLMPPALFAEESAVHATSRRNGRFSIAMPADKPLLSGNPETLLAYKPGAGIAVLTFDQLNRPIVPIELKLQPTKDVHVRVFDPGNIPVRDAAVELVYIDPPDASSWPTGSIGGPHFKWQTDERGEILIRCLPAGARFYLRVRTGSFGTQECHFDHATEHAFILRPVGRLRGRVLAGPSMPAPGVPLRVISRPRSTSASGPSVIGTANIRSDADGRLDVAALAEGAVFIPALEESPDSPDLLPRHVSAELKRGETTSVDIPVVRGIRVYGRVLEEGGARPVAGARIYLEREKRRHVLSNKEGIFEYYMLPGPILAVFEEAPAPFLNPFSSSLGQTQLKAGARDFEFEPLTLRRGVMLAGHVIDGQKKPAAFARVEAAWTGRGPANSFQDQHVTAVTDEAGAFTIGPVDEKELVEVMASDETRGSLEVISVDPSDAAARESIRVPIEPAGMITISGRVVDTQGDPIPETRVRFASGATTLQLRRLRRPIRIDFHGRFGSVITDQNGNFRTPCRVPRLAVYMINVITPDFLAKGVGVSVPADVDNALVLPDIVVAPGK
jgi:hypothetical protein